VLRLVGESGTDSIADACNIPPCVTSAPKRRIQTRERPTIFNKQTSGFLYIIIRQDSSVRLLRKLKVSKRENSCL
jgi:hypothetical protein